MSLLRLLAIGTLLIALVHGQNDFDTDDTGDPEQNFNENDMPSSGENEQESGDINFNGMEQSLKSMYNRIEDKIGEYKEKADEIDNKLRMTREEENGNNYVQSDSINDNGIQEDDNNELPLSSEYEDDGQRQKRSFRKRLREKWGRIREKLRPIGKEIVRKYLEGFIGRLFGR